MCENHKQVSKQNTVAPKIHLNKLNYSSIAGYQTLFKDNITYENVQSLIQKTNDTVKNMLAGKKENFKFLSLPAILGDIHAILKTDTTNEELLKFVDRVNTIV